MVLSKYLKMDLLIGSNIAKIATINQLIHFAIILETLCTHRNILKKLKVKNKLSQSRSKQDQSQFIEQLRKLSSNELADAICPKYD